MNEQQFSQELNPGLHESGQMGPPHLLRQAREGAGLHIAALAAALKVPVRKLEALEAGRYDELPDMTFARALASSACRQLKVDPAPVLEQIPHAAQPALGDSQDAINAPFRSATGGGSLGSLAWLKRPAVLIALALILGALGLVFVPDRFLDFLPRTGGEPSSEVSLIEPVSVTEPVAESGAATPGLTLSMTSPSDDSSAIMIQPPAQAAVPPVPASAVAPETAASAEGPATKSLLSLTATGESWIEVVNGSGGVLMQRVLKAGDVVEFSSSPPYAVVLGRADAVQVTVRGKAFDVMSSARNNVARFEVK